MADFVFLVSVKEIVAALVFGIMALVFSIGCYFAIIKAAEVVDRITGHSKHWHIAPEDRHHDIH